MTVVAFPTKYMDAFSLVGLLECDLLFFTGGRVCGNWSALPSRVGGWRWFGSISICFMVKMNISYVYGFDFM